MTNNRKFKATHFPNGISDSPLQGALEEYASLDPTRFYQFFNDFTQFNSDEWAIFVVGGGSTQTILAENGGVVQITVASGVGSAVRVELPRSFTLEAGKRLFYLIRVRLNESINTGLYTGLVDNDIIGPSDGIRFIKNPGESALQFSLTENASSVNYPQNYDFQNDQFAILGCYYDGKTSIKTFVDETPVSNIPLNLNANYFDNPFSIEMGLTNNEANVNNFSVDYLFIAKER